MACYHVYAPIKSLRTSLLESSDLLHTHLAPAGMRCNYYYFVFMQALLLWNGLIFAPRFSLITFANLRTDLINVMRETASQEAALWSWPVRLILQGLLHPLVSSLLFFFSPGLVVSFSHCIVALLGFLPAVLHLPKSCGERFFARIRLWPAVLHLPWSCGAHSFVFGLLFFISPGLVVSVLLHSLLLHAACCLTASQQATMCSQPHRPVLQGLLHPLVSSLLFFMSQVLW